MKVYFLGASLPLTKTIRFENNKLHKDGYPTVKNFTSYETEVETIGDLYKHMLEHAAKGHCLLKGVLSEPLISASRKGLMPPSTHTRWVCFDLDRAPFSTPDEFMKAVGCEDVSYIVQYSASYKLNKKDPTLSCHIFVLLDKDISPNNLKVWLMHLNLDIKVLDDNLTLSASGSALHWPLDITTCQNDKLLYITKPVLVGLKDPVTDRIQLVLREQPVLNIARIEIKPLDAMKQKARMRLNQLRVDAGFNEIKGKVRVLGEFHVQPGASAATTWEIREEIEYVRYNLNGGDSWAYWHPKNSWELLHSFKGEDSMFMKDVLPDVYAELNAKQRNSLMSNANGEQLLAFREKVSADYWKGLATETSLEIYKVKSELQLDHFLQAHGSALGPFVPEWTMVFDPKLPFIVDNDNNIVNTFVPTPLMREARPSPTPIIQRIIDHAVGTGETQEYFLNWLAVIMQHRIKTQIAWVLHGTFGTGKGLIVNHILKPIFRQYVHQVEAPGLISQFAGWRVGKLIIMVDEIEVDLFEDLKVESKLRNWISEPLAEIEQKNRDKYSVPCFNNWIFGSNKPVPVRIPRKDRRTNVGEYQPNRFITTREEIEIELPKEIEGFANYLLTRKADINKAMRILNNDARREIQSMSLSSVDEIAEAIIYGDFEKLYEHMPDMTVLNGMTDNIATVYADLLRQWSNERTTNITRDQLTILFQHCIGRVPEGKNKFTTWLKHHGIKTKKIRMDNSDTAYGITVEWKPSQMKIELASQKTKLRRVK